MKSACCLLLLLTLVPAYQAIKCLCDKEVCSSGTGAEEECTNIPGAGLFGNDANNIKDEIMNLYQEIGSKMRNNTGESWTDGEASKLMPGLNEQRNEIFKKLTPQQQAKFNESFQKFDSFKKLNKDNPNVLPEEYSKMMEDLFQQRSSVPQPMSYQFCMKVTDDSGKTARGCGAAFVPLLGGVTEVGCHGNPSYNPAMPGIQKYCRCDTDLCNSGDVEDGSSATKIASIRISTSLLLVVMLETFLD